MAVKINKDLCPQDHKCPALSACAVGALSQKGNSAPTVDENLCIECGACANACPKGALHL